MAIRCKGCKYYQNGACTLSNKPYLCNIRGEYGNYNNLSESDITYSDDFGNVYAFRSYRQYNKFIKILNYRLRNFDKLQGQLYQYKDKNIKVFDLTELNELIYKKAYEDALNGKVQIHTKS